MIRKLIFFFPLQLLLVNLKRNHLLLLLWLILFGFVGKGIASKYGIPYLFLAPEYLDTVNFWSYCIVGFAIGGFVMTFNISSYIINSKRFPFIATLKSPFVKFCINNSLLPLIFVIYYCFKVIVYHIEFENTEPLTIAIYILGVITGYSINIMLSLTYFLSTNKNVFKILGISDSKSETPAHSLFSKESSIYSILKSRDKWHVELYLHSPLNVRYAKKIEHYNDEMLKTITTHNHINASIFEIVVFASLIILGLFGENEFFAIPAGASIILFFTIIFILISAFYTWLKGWTTIVLVCVFLLFNYLSKRDLFNFDNRAYGLNYETEKAEYSIAKINQLSKDKKLHERDYKSGVYTLQQWKQKNQKDSLPKIIFINTSGGGSRSSLWTFCLLQLSDSLTHGNLFSQTHLITGSSGGMIGAAYFRELYLRKDSLGEPLYGKKYRNNMAKDLLNPVAFSIATNDMFIRLKKHRDGKYIYTKDRGYAFEKRLLKNTGNILDKRLVDYIVPEKEAEIPTMIFSPTIINDGRRLLVSAQPISYLSDNTSESNCLNNPIIDNVEFTRLFKNQDAYNLKYTNVLRMSATFPIIMPKVALPSQPEITVMDAGMRDNYGYLTTFKYIYTFRKWIDENTSGIIILDFRDKLKELPISDNAVKSITENLFSPVGSLYDNLFSTQDYNQDEMLLYLSSNIEKPIDVINFELNNKSDEISLSWHLTTKEKEKVVNSVYTDKNQENLKRLIELIGR